MKTLAMSHPKPKSAQKYCRGRRIRGGAQTNDLPPPQPRSERKHKRGGAGTKKENEKVCLRRGSDGVRHDGRSGHGNDMTPQLLCAKQADVAATGGPFACAIDLCLCAGKKYPVARKNNFPLGEFRGGNWLAPNSKHVYRSLLMTM